MNTAYNEKLASVWAGPVVLREEDFSRLSSFIEHELGIKMPPAKRVMLESRLSKRLRHYGYKNFSDYVDYVFSPEGSRTELIEMIDSVTTNKTDFFREADHFDYLLNEVLPQYSGNEIFKIWSAGCSTGEEPYTLAMVAEEYKRVTQKFRYSIVASDISTKVLRIAQAAVYEEEKVSPVPLDYKKRYLLRSKNRQNAIIRIKPDLRAKLQFQRLNLMDADLGYRETFNVIFCRNVIIYFDRVTQEQLIRKFYKALKPGGYLFLGHSETMAGMNINFKVVSPTVYIKEG